ncbi:MAG: lysophospholipid acyltransferase family protein [Candidatus Rifleibacteriota bacterium]
MSKVETNKVKTGHKLQILLLDYLTRKTTDMSLPKRQRTARLISGIVFDLLQLRREYVINSLQAHLKINRREAIKTARKTYYNFLLNAFEMAGLKYWSKAEILEKISCDSLANLEKALSRKKGAIIVSGHYGLWELVPPWLSIKGFPVTVVVRRQNNPEADKWMNEMRTKHGALTTDSGYSIRQILKSLRKGHILALMVDQDNGKQGIFVKFLCSWASAPTGPAQISLKTGAPVVPLVIKPDYKNKHKLKIFEPVFPENFTNTLQGQQLMTQKYTSLLEQIIKANPEQWFWLHRRWKTNIKDAPENKWVKLINSF